MEKIMIGKIVNVVGLKGEVKVYNYSGFEDRYENLERIIAGNAEFKIESVRHQQQMIILKLVGVDNRDGAEALRGKNVYITEDDLLELPEEEFYIRDLIGMEVIDAESGERLGVLADVMTDRPQDIYVVKLNDGGQCLIPAVDEFIKGIDGEARQIRVTLIEGMIEGMN
jgi:16S rRNA processing protein RimM